MAIRGVGCQTDASPETRDAGTQTYVAEEELPPPATESEVWQGGSTEGLGCRSRALFPSGPGVLAEFGRQLRGRVHPRVCRCHLFVRRDTEALAPGRVAAAASAWHAAGSGPAISFASLARATASCQMRFETQLKVHENILSNFQRRRITNVNRNITEAPRGLGGGEMRFETPMTH